MAARAAVLFALFSLGDRAQTVTINGVDPLEVLDLFTKPNVIVVLDTSASMLSAPGAESTTSTSRLPGGDALLNRATQAKEVLRAVVTAHEQRANFLLATYTQRDIEWIGKAAGQPRFLYYTTSAEAGGGANLQVLQNSLRDTTFVQNGLQSWQVIRPGWQRFYFSEAVGIAAPASALRVVIDGRRQRFHYRVNPSTSSGVLCTVTLPASVHGTYTESTIGTLIDRINERLVAGALPAALAGDRRCRNFQGDYRNRVAWTGGLVEPGIGLAVSWSAAGRTFTVTPTGGAYQLLGPGEQDALLPQLGFFTSVPAGLGPHGGIINGNQTTSSTSQPAVGVPVGSPVVGNANVIRCEVRLALGFYRRKTDFAKALEDGMNACPELAGRRASSATSVNTYRVVMNPFEQPETGTIPPTPALPPGTPPITGLTGMNGRFIISRDAAFGSNPFQILWSETPSNIASALGMTNAADTAFGAGPYVAGPGYIVLYRSASTGRNSDTGDPDASGPAGYTTYATFLLYASRFFNGERIWVTNRGVVCNVLSGPATSPPTIRLEEVIDCAATASRSSFVYRFSGSYFSGNTIPCSGLQTRVELAACDSTTSQLPQLRQFLAPEVPLTSDGLAVPGYAEHEDGSYALRSPPDPGGVTMDGATPITYALRDIKTVFDELWTTGRGPVTAIRTHPNPKERTVVLFVTDGDDTCTTSGANGTGSVLFPGDTRITMQTAFQAYRLYTPIVGSVDAETGELLPGSDPASSVTVYMVGYGNSVNMDLLDQVAWAGSGITTETNTFQMRLPSRAERDLCTTCVDAFRAPDTVTLARAVETIVEQAVGGRYTAQPSTTASVFEYAALLPGFDPREPRTRYDAAVPTRVETSFFVPRFQGHVRAFQDAAGAPVERWDAGVKLQRRVSDGMAAVTALPNALAGQASFWQLYAGATDTEIAASSAGIKRRIYTTERNGVFDVVDANLAGLRSGASPGRVPLWPPSDLASPSSVAPFHDELEGSLDVELGLPTDAALAADPAGEYARLFGDFEACRGFPAPAACFGTPLAAAKRARREARERILAFVAGAEPAVDSDNQPRRVDSGPEQGAMLFRARRFVMFDSTLSTPTVVGPPLELSPDTTPWVPEYRLYRDGPRAPGYVAVDGLAQGFGLRNPDLDAQLPSRTLPPPANFDTRDALKPAMTVVYQGANDMLHAFRAGPSCGDPGGTGSGARYTGCAEQGGEELWGFVPYDRLGVLRRLLQPQQRATKTYVVATSLRFADVFVPAPSGAFATTIGAAAVSGRGVWRTLLFFGRGPGGKYLTALDVTNRGPFTGTSLESQAPIVLWSRGNRDTHDGTATGTPSNVTIGNRDGDAYAKMGETWSVPAVAFVDAPRNVTARKPGGVPFVLYAGSGYGAAGEGATFFALDALTGDVVQAVDLEREAGFLGVTRAGLTYPNALVASPTVYGGLQLKAGQPSHPSDRSTRVYIGDLHGRLWKFLTIAPSQPLLAADLGANQAVGVAASLLALGDAPSPYVYVASGNDLRATGPFKVFGFKDEGTDTDTGTSIKTPTFDPRVFVYPPFAFLFSREFPAGFRGTLQPTTVLTADRPPKGRVFFGGTRLNPARPGVCRSTFDSIVFALGAETGGAAYDFGGADSSYRVFTDSRLIALQVIRTPTTGGTPGSDRLVLEEGLPGRGLPSPPPPAGTRAAVADPPITVTFAPRDSEGRMFPQWSVPQLCQ